jgi:hypothetical protein
LASGVVKVNWIFCTPLGMYSLGRRIQSCENESEWWFQWYVSWYIVKWIGQERESNDSHMKEREHKRRKKLWWGKWNNQWCIVLLCSQFNQMAIIYGPSWTNSFKGPG